jgi:hypothetical protein
MKLARSAGTSGLGPVLALWYVFKNRSVVIAGSFRSLVDALRSNVDLARVVARQWCSGRRMVTELPTARCTGEGEREEWSFTRQASKRFGRERIDLFGLEQPEAWPRSSTSPKWPA